VLRVHAQAPDVAPLLPGPGDSLVIDPAPALTDRLAILQGIQHAVGTERRAVRNPFELTLRDRDKFPLILEGLVLQSS